MASRGDEERAEGFGRQIFDVLELMKVRPVAFGEKAKGWDRLDCDALTDGAEAGQGDEGGADAAEKADDEHGVEGDAEAMLES